MTAWEYLIRPSVVGIGPYEPGPSLDEIMVRHGLTHVDKLNWNEGLWGPLPGVLDAVAASLDDAWKYPDHAYHALRDAIAAETGAAPEQVLPGHGIQALIITLIAAFLRPGDRVVVPEPTYGLYAQASRAAGAEVVRVPSPGLRVDLEAMAAATREPGVRMAWICDPNNPTGACIERDEWWAFLDAASDDCVVVADEAYVDYLEPADRVGRERDVADGRPLVVLRTFSKIFGLAGLRLGYALGDPELLRYLHSVQEPFNVNRAALAAGLASLGRADEVAERRAVAAAARERLGSALVDAGMTVLPSGANFVCIDVGRDDVALADRLLLQGILIRPLADMGLPGHVRITVGPNDAMDRAAAALLADAVPA